MTTPALHVLRGIHTRILFRLLRQRENFSYMMNSSQRAMLRFSRNPYRQPLSFTIHCQKRQGMLESHLSIGSRMGRRTAADEKEHLIPWTTSWARTRTLMGMVLLVTMTGQAIWKASIGTGKEPMIISMTSLIIVESVERRTKHGNQGYINRFSQGVPPGEATGGIYVSILPTCRPIN